MLAYSFLLSVEAEMGMLRAARRHGVRARIESRFETMLFRDVTDRLSGFVELIYSFERCRWGQWELPLRWS